MVFWSIICIVLFILVIISILCHSKRTGYVLALLVLASTIHSYNINKAYCNKGLWNAMKKSTSAYTKTDLMQASKDMARVSGLRGTIFSYYNGFELVHFKSEKEETSKWQE